MRGLKPTFGGGKSIALVLPRHACIGIRGSVTCARSAWTDAQDWWRSHAVQDVIALRGSQDF